MTENSSARIGWNNSINGPTGANAISYNDIGILVIGSSSAAIADNYIHHNTRPGIAVWRGAHADPSDNWSHSVGNPKIDATAGQR